MNILHYSLGLPPYRSGGLTKYVHDLMVEQVKQGDKVFLLFPGTIKWNKKNVKIKYYKNYKGIEVYELINPLPVPLLEGIVEPLEFMKKTDIEIFLNFFIQNNVNVLHIHTFMGLYKEFLEAAKRLSIKILYTTHDYFELCPKVNFYAYDDNVCENRNLTKCVVCNKSAYSLKKIMILQSPLYRLLKSSFLFRYIKKLSMFPEIKSKRKCYKNEINNYDVDDLKKLIKYYEDMFGLVDLFLFNSSVSEKIYKKYIDKARGIVLPITHSDIRDNRREKSFNEKQLSITYLGPTKKYKGFFNLISVMQEIQKKGYTDIILNVYGDITVNQKNMPPNVKLHSRYVYDDLENIFNKTDLLIVPSQCFETFGFITLEALSYGVPVVVTKNVGSKDLLNNNITGYIIDGYVNEMCELIINLYLNRVLLRDINNNILNSEFEYSMESHVKKLNYIYLSVDCPTKS